MIEYLNLLRNIFDNGEERTDRTGVGTISVFGTQTRYDLSKTFPATTTKKLAWKSVVSELLWFIEGSSDERRLAEILHGTTDSEKKTVWTDNCNKQSKDLGYPNSELGPVYGYHWRYVYNPSFFPVKKKVSKYNSAPIEFAKPINNAPPQYIDRLRALWLKMVNSDKKYYYPWKDFDVFANDAIHLEGFKWFKMNSNVELFSDYYGENIFAPDTTVIIPTSHVQEYRNEHNLFVISPDFPTRYYPSYFAYNIDKPVGQVYDYHSEDHVIRHQFPVDQLETLISEIKTNPDSRRLLLTSLEPGSVNKATLPPCHVIIQFYVSDNKLSAQLYQRSCDIGLGCPFNIASYSLMIHMIAHVCGLCVGEFIHTIGDAHIYKNHESALREQLARTPITGPTLNIKRKVSSIDDFTMDDFELVNYNPHAAIKMSMAV